MLSLWICQPRKSWLQSLFRTCSRDAAASLAVPVQGRITDSLKVGSCARAVLPTVILALGWVVWGRMGPCADWWDCARCCFKNMQAAALSWEEVSSHVQELMFDGTWGALSSFYSYFSEWSGKELFKEESDFIDSAVLAPDF